jgi:hypothetical protein
VAFVMARGGIVDDLSKAFEKLALRTGGPP